MKINPHIYETLTPRQRALALLEAVRRNDTSEADRLRKSCPQFTYTSMDFEFIGFVENLMHTSTTVQLDIAISVLKYAWYEYDPFLMLAKSVEAGWYACLQDFGIDEETAKATMASPDELVANILSHAPSPDPDRVARFKHAFTMILNKSKPDEVIAFLESEGQRVD